MSDSTEGRPAEARLDACALCGAPLAASARRCPTCGMLVDLALPAPSPFSHRALWATVGGLAAIYAVVLLLVVALR